MPFKTGNLAGKLTRKELIEQYGEHFEKMGKFWTRQDIIDKLQKKGVSVEGEDPVEVVEEVVEVVEEEVVEEEVVEEVKPAPKKRGRPKKQK